MPGEQYRAHWLSIATRFRAACHDAGNETERAFMIRMAELYEDRAARCQVPGLQMPASLPRS